MDIGQGLKKAANFELLLNSLLSVIEQEIDVYRELGKIIAEEADVLMKPGLDSIAASNAKKDDCVFKARLLEEERSKLVRDIAWALGKKGKEINFTVISAYCDAGRAAQLESQRQILFPLIKAINEANAKNMGLLDFSLSYVRGSLDFVNNLLSAGANYERTGQLKTDSLQGRVVNSKG
ncbi:MAG: flagellar protein FlgN [Syntrophales bacterium]|nr:flagellar protein FlgN [Syntrophales bacterium]